jgi:hypothetical protein
MTNTLLSLVQPPLAGVLAALEGRLVGRIGVFHVVGELGLRLRLFGLRLLGSRPAATTSTMRGTARNASINQAATNSSSKTARTQARSGQGFRPRSAQK